MVYKIWFKKLLAFALLFSSFAPALVYSQNLTPEEMGLEIAEYARAGDVGYGNFTAQIVMVLRNKKGQETQRSLRIKSLEVTGNGDKSLFIFDEPRDVKGTALLIFAHKDKADEQWLYLPALKRVKRISSSNKSGSFMGSEFSYEDLTTQEVEKFTYRYLRDEPCSDLVCTVTERFPVDKKSGYKRQIVWQDKEEFRTWKVEYFDRKNAHLKTLTVEGYQQYLDQFWRAQKMVMVNHLSGKSTDFILEEYAFRTEIDEKEFTKTGLKRAR